MANKTTTTTTTTRKVTFKSFVNMLAYIAIVFVGLALLINQIFPSVGSALQLIANIISYALVGYFSFNYAKSKRHWAYILVWIIAVALILVMVILNASL